MNPLLLYLLFNPKYYLESCLRLFSNQDYSQPRTTINNTPKGMYAK